MSAPRSTSGPAATTGPRHLRADADRIHELHEAGELEAARAACDALEAAAGDRLDDVVIRESVFTARSVRARMDAESGDLDGALSGYLSAAALPFDVDDPDQSHELAMALLNAGICWSAGGDPAAAVATYDDLLLRLGDATDPVTGEQVVKARVNRGVALLELGRTDEAVAAADDVLDRLGDTLEPLVAEQRGMALRLRAQGLRDLERADDALATLTAVDALVAVDDAATRAQVVAATGERAELLAELGRAGEAIELLEATVDRFAGDEDVADVVVDLRHAEAELLEARGDVDRAAAVRGRI